MPLEPPDAQVHDVPAGFLIEAFDDTNLFVQLHVAPAVATRLAAAPDMFGPRGGLRYGDWPIYGGSTYIYLSKIVNLSGSAQMTRG